MLRTGFIDYSCVTRKSKSCKEILQEPPLRTGSTDYTCVTRKTNRYKEMRVIGGVPIIPVSHVNLTAPTRYGLNEFSAPRKCVRTARQEAVAADGRRLTVQARVSSSEPRPESCFAPRRSTVGIRHGACVRSLVTVARRNDTRFRAKLRFWPFHREHSLYAEHSGLKLGVAYAWVAQGGVMERHGWTCSWDGFETRVFGARDRMTLRASPFPPLRRGGGQGITNTLGQAGSSARPSSSGPAHQAMVPLGPPPLRKGGK